SDIGLAETIGNTPPQNKEQAERLLPFLAPEQMSNEPKLTPATDVYALGVGLFQSLTGRVPFPADAVTARLNEGDRYSSRRSLPRPSDFVPDVPEILDDIITSCLYTDPLRRPADGEDLAERLREAARETPESALIYLSRATAAYRALSGPR